MSRDDAPPDKGVCYEVRNKVFRIHFWTKDDAQKFLDTTSPAEGYRIEELRVFSGIDWGKPLVGGGHNEPR